MIGQRRVKSIIKCLKKLPKFIIVSGPSGSGKSLFITELCKYKLGTEPIQVSSMDDIRNICTTAVSVQQDTAYVLSDFDSINFRTKEAILKLCEEPPEHIYIFIETISTANIKQTLLSRAFLFELDNYSKEDLRSFCMSIENITEAEVNTCLDLFSTPGSILRAKSMGLQEFLAFCKKTASFVSTATFGNALKISNSLKLKADGTGYDIDLFFSTVANYALNMVTELGIDTSYNIINACSKANTTLVQIPTINKQMLFDTWLMQVHGIG